MARTATNPAAVQHNRQRRKARTPGDPAAPGASLSTVRMAKLVAPEYMSVVDAELATSISRWFWRSLAYAGKVESVKLGSPKNGRLVIPVAEVRRVMAEATRPRVDAVEPRAVAR
jgi:hypothetical protein